MAFSERAFILIMIAYFVPVLLTGILLYFESRSTAANFNSMVQRIEFNQGLKALEIVINAGNNYTSAEIIEILQSCTQLLQRNIAVPKNEIPKRLTVIFSCCLGMYYLALIMQTTAIEVIGMPGLSFRTLRNQPAGECPIFTWELATGGKNKKGVDRVAVVPGGVEEEAGVSA